MLKLQRAHVMRILQVFAWFVLNINHFFSGSQKTAKNASPGAERRPGEKINELHRFPRPYALAESGHYYRQPYDMQLDFNYYSIIPCPIIYLISMWY